MYTKEIKNNYILSIAIRISLVIHIYNIDDLYISYICYSGGKIISGGYKSVFKFAILTCKSPISVL